MKINKSKKPESDKREYLIDGRYMLIEILDMEKLEYFFNLFTASTGFTASLIIYPDHNILIKSGCRKLCQELKCIDPAIARECIAEDLLLDSEIREQNEITMRISGIGLADGALPVFVRGVYCANIISGHVFLEKPNPDLLLRTSGESDIRHYLQMVGGIENIPVVKEDVLKASLIMLRDMTVLLAEQKLNMLYGEDSRNSLKASEQFFRGIADSIPGVVYRFYVRPDGDMGFSFINGRAVEILGIDGDTTDLFPKIVRQIPPEEREEFILSISEAVQECKRWEYEGRLITPSGEERFIHGISHPERAGDEIVFNGVLLDVTERRRAEELLKESEARYREIFEDATMGIYQSLPEGRYRIVNRAFAEMAGFESPEQMISEVKNIGEQLYANPEERLLLNKHLGEDGFVRNAVFEFRKKNGDSFWGSVNSVVIRDEKGEPLYYHGTLLDVTDRKKAEDALRLSEERYRMLADFTGEIIYDRDLCRGGTRWAGRADELTGFSIKELEYMGIEGWRGRIHPDDVERVLAEIDIAIKEKTVFSVEYGLMESDGTYMFIEESGGCIYDESGKPVRMLGAMKDISDRVFAAEERLQMESLGIMAGGIAHDFNNLLMGIMGSIELAMMDVNHGTPLHKNLKRAMNASHRAADITGKMLAYSGKGHFVMTQLQPASILKEMRDILRSAVPLSISIKTEISESLPVIMADASQFRQVLINIVVNSSEAIGDKQGEILITAGEEFISAEYLVSKRLDSDLKPGSYVCIDISDNGCGMDENIRKKIFEPFFSTKQTGRGLGLPAVQGIMRGHGGAVIIESVNTSGTKVRIIFPAHVEREEVKQRGVSYSGVSSKSEQRSSLVLVVDDEDVVRDLCMEFVSIAGYKVIGAADGLKGVEIFKEESDNLAGVLLDLSMPRMDGVTAFHEMKKINPDIPVILCSGYSEDDATRSFAGETLAGFLQKPYKLDVLAEKLDEVFKSDPVQ
jgi:PAS domain S-box-containing protein